jgi:hypothetical protein
MSVQVTDHLHVGRMSLLQTRWNLKADGGVIGNRLISLDRQGGQEHEVGPEQQHTGTHGAPWQGSST